MNAATLFLKALAVLVKGYFDGLFIGLKKLPEVMEIDGLPLLTEMKIEMEQSAAFPGLGLRVWGKGGFQIAEGLLKIKPLALFFMDQGGAAEG